LDALVENKILKLGIGSGNDSDLVFMALVRGNLCIENCETVGRGGKGKDFP
jgi:hypothetical protein